MADQHDGEVEPERRAEAERRPLPVREARLAEALRANLRRRKAQLRDRRLAQATENRQD